jgi:hypothetical protein
VNAIREDLGSVGPVIAKQIEEAMLGKRLRLNTEAAETEASKARKILSAEKRLRERIARLHEKLLEAKNDFHLSPEHIANAVKVALELAEKPPLNPVPLAGNENATVFEVPPLSGSWGGATSGLEHPHTGIRRPITFDHDAAKGRDDVVLVHLNHRLTQMCLRLLREEIWKLDDVKKLERNAVRCVSDEEYNVPLVAVWSRLLITGGDHSRLHEELTLSGGELEHKRFARIAQSGKLESILEKSAPFEPDEALFGILRDRFDLHRNAIMAAVDARSRDRMENLENTLARRMKSEMDDIEAVLDELEESIRKELKPDEYEYRQLYLPGFSPEETEQVKKDVRALEARLARIPEERKKERAAVESHYGNPAVHTFPVAVVFLIPKKMSENT